MNEELKIIITAEIEDLKKQVEAAQEEIKGLNSKGSKGFGGFGNAAKAAGKAVGTAMKAVGAAVLAAGAALLGAGAATKDYQIAQAKLKTAFEAAGSSADVAKQTYNDLYRVLGDDQQAVEAANHLAQMTTNQKELEQWTKITQGVYATFGDSLPIESLTEAANETAKTGELTGALADALNWAGVAEEDFQAQLLMCNTEAEREALIRSTLNGIYSGAAEGYEKNAAAILAENEAQAKLTEAMATLGGVALPIMAALKTLAADVLTQLTPFVEMIGNGLKGAMEGTAGASKLMAQGLSGIIDALVNLINDMLPAVIQLIVDLIPEIIRTLLNALPSILDTVINGVILIINALAEMLPEIVDAIMEVLPILINQLIAAIPDLLDAAITLLMAIVDAIPVIIVELLNALPDIITNLMSSLNKASPKLLQSGVQLFQSLVKAIPQVIPALVKNIPQIIKAIMNGLKDGVKQIPQIGKDLIKGLWNGISDMVGWITDKIKGFGENILGGIKKFFGIKSPSKVMENIVGKNLALGIGEGFMDNMAGVNKDIEKSIAPLTHMSVSGTISGPSALSTSASGLKPINAGSTSIEALAKALNNNNKKIILQVDKRTLGQITVEGINDITKLTGSIPLQFA
jgi:phage-related protein